MGTKSPGEGLIGMDFVFREGCTFQPQLTLDFLKLNFAGMEK